MRAWKHPWTHKLNMGYGPMPTARPRSIHLLVSTYVDHWRQFLLQNCLGSEWLSLYPITSPPPVATTLEEVDEPLESSTHDEDGDNHNNNGNNNNNSNNGRCNSRGPRFRGKVYRHSRQLALLYHTTIFDHAPVVCHCCPSNT